MVTAAGSAPAGVFVFVKAVLTAFVKATVPVIIVFVKAALMVLIEAMVPVIIVFVKAALAVVSVKFSSVIHLTVDDYYLRGFGFISISV